MHTTFDHASPSILPAIGRVLLAAIFIVSGIGKTLVPEAAMGYIAASGLPFASLALGLAILIEIGGGLLLVLGFRTRLVALGLALFSVATAAAFHHALGDQRQLVHLLKNVAIAGGLLQVVAFGAGACSLDAAAGRKRTPQAA